MKKYNSPKRKRNVIKNLVTAGVVSLSLGGQLIGLPGVAFDTNVYAAETSKVQTSSKDLGFDVLSQSHEFYQLAQALNSPNLTGNALITSSGSENSLSSTLTYEVSAPGKMMDGEEAVYLGDDLVYNLDFADYALKEMVNHNLLTFSSSDESVSIGKNNVRSIDISHETTDPDKFTRENVITFRVTATINAPISFDASTTYIPNITANARFVAKDTVPFVSRADASTKIVNTQPLLKVNTKILYAKVGQVFEPDKMIDATSGDAKLTIKNYNSSEELLNVNPNQLGLDLSTVNTSVPGDYDLGYAGFLDNQLLAGKITVRVLADASIQLTPDEYIEGHDTLTGTASKILETVKLEHNGTEISTAKLTSASTDVNNVAFSGLTGISVGDQLQMVGYDHLGNELSRQDVTIKGVQNQMDISPYAWGDTKLSGTAGIDILNTKLFVNGVEITELGTQPVASDRTFSFTGVEKYASEGDKIEVAGYGSNGELNRVEVTPEKNRASILPDDFHEGDTQLTGTYGSNVKKVRLYVNDHIKAEATLKDSQFKFENTESIKKDDKVQAVGYDENGTEISRVDISILDAQAEKDYSLTADDYTLGNYYLTGTRGKDVSAVRLLVNDKVVKQAELKEDGTYKFSGIKTLINEGDKVQVIAVDDKYKTENTVDVKVNQDEVEKDYSLTADDYTLGNYYLTGTRGKDVSAVRLLVNDKVVKQAELKEDGTYKFSGIKTLINEGDKVQVIAVDDKYKTENTVDVKVNQDEVEKDYSLTADDYTLGNYYLTGTQGKDVSAVRLLVNDKVVKQAELKEDGTYKFSGIKALISKGDKVQVIAVDDKYKTENTIDITIGQSSFLSNIF